MVIPSPDLAFRNLAAIWSNGLALRTFEDKDREKTFDLTNKLLQAVGGKDLEELEVALKYLYWDLRGHIPHPTNPGLTWSSRRTSLQAELARNQQVLGVENLEAGKGLIACLNSLSENDLTYGQEILGMLSDEPETVFVVEKPRQRAELEALLVSNISEPRYQVFNLGRFVSFPPTDFRRVVILAAPRKLSDNYMRAIVLGGISSNITFLAPNWLTGPEPSRIHQELAPTLQVKPLPLIHVVGPKFERKIVEVALDAEQLNEYSNPSDIEKLILNGDIDCRYIHINDGLVIPVEDDAARISTLERQDHGLLKVEFKNPFDGLEVGDIVFNLRDGAEDAFLMDLAAMAMGAEFRAFTAGRLAWKTRAQALVNSQGLSSAIEFLKSKGVSTAHYLNDWIEEDDFVSPRAKVDWTNLLKALEFSAAEVKSLTSLSTKVRSNLISVGQQARSAMADSIETSDWERLQAGKVVSKKLSEYGDAEFLLSAVTAVGDAVFKCHPNDLRKVRRL